MSLTHDEDLQLKHVEQIGEDEFFISTIKMDVRHSWLNEHQNVNVYETMVFSKKDGKVQYHDSLYHKRYSKHQDAIKGHDYIVKNISKIISVCYTCKKNMSSDS